MEVASGAKLKVGRPSAGRTNKLQIRLTPKEKESFEQAAQKHGMSLSDWVRLNLRALSLSM